MSTIGQVSLPGDIHSRTPKWGNVWKSTLQSLVVTKSTLEELGSQGRPPPFRNAWGKGQTWWERWRRPGGDVCDLVRTKNFSWRSLDREDAPNACSPGRWIPGHSRCTGKNHTNYWAPRRKQWGLRGGKKPVRCKCCCKIADVCWARLSLRSSSPKTVTAALPRKVFQASKKKVPCDCKANNPRVENESKERKTTTTHPHIKVHQIS